MKLNLDFKKFLCCVLLSFIMAFGNVPALFNGLVLSDLNKIYAGDEYYTGFFRVDRIDLNKSVYLTGYIKYYYSYDPVDGHKVFKEIGTGAFDRYLLRLGNCCGDYFWSPGDYSWTLNDNVAEVNVNIKGTLEKLGFWHTVDDISIDYAIGLSNL